MSHLSADLRYAWRTLRSSPVFTLVAALSIGLGIGANTAIFTLVDQVLLRLLPVRNPDQLVMLKGPVGDQHYGGNWGPNTLSYPMYTDFRDHNDVFEGMFCRYSIPAQVGVNGATERVNGEMVSGSYFPVLGVGTAAGRLIGPDDDRVPGGHPVAVLSYGYWVSRFNRNPGVIGSALIVNNQPLTVIGVAQEGFLGVDIGNTTQVFVPVMMKQQLAPGWHALDNRRARWVQVFGRLKPGITAEAAQARLQPYFHSIIEMEVKEQPFARASTYTKTQFLRGQISVLTGSQGFSRLRGGLTKPLWVLMALVGGVLLIACANVANLLVARAAVRQREMAIRLALGASRVRVVQQLLVESLLIAIAGGLIGVAVALVATGPLLGLLVPLDQQVAVKTSLDVRLLAFAFGATLLTGVLFGLAPALQATRPQLAPTLKDQAGSVAGGGALRLRKALVIVQVALSLLLLIGAGLFVRSIGRLLAEDVGFRTEHLVSFMVDPPRNGYTDARTRQFYQTLRAKLLATPGVRDAAVSGGGLLNGGNWDQWMTVEGYQTAENETIDPYCDAISPGFFRTLGVPIIAGRDFDERDAEPNPNPPPGQQDSRVAIVSERFAQKYFPNGQAIGRHIGSGKDPGTPTPIEIVGVVKNARFTSIREEPPYFVFFPNGGGGGGAIHVRTDLDANQIFPRIREIVREIDPNLPVFGQRTVEQVIQQSTRNERLMATLSAAFSTLATLLAMIGLYGVMAYTVTRRRREIGIRMALGALRSHVSWLVLREMLILAIAGIAIALPAAWWLGQFVKSQLYGVVPMDPTITTFAIVGLIGVAMLAAAIPTVRATRTNPVTALRQD